MTNSSDVRRNWFVATAGLLAVIGIGWVVWSRLPPPQLEVDGQVFTTVDALFTAIRSRDGSRMEGCERRLKTYHDEGRISDAVASALDAIIQQARGGEWEPAAKRLHAFMRGQRGHVRTAAAARGAGPRFG